MREQSEHHLSRSPPFSIFPLLELDQSRLEEAACVAYLFAARWPHGFVCAACGRNKAWQLRTKVWTWECAGCGKQSSVTAGTIKHSSKLPLTIWFWAAYLMATHSNGISALQLQRQLALGSYKSAWLMTTKLRRSMVALGRSALAGLVEVDETEIVCRSKNDPLTGGGGRSYHGKLLVVGAVEVEDGGVGPGRIRLAQVRDYSAASLHAFIKTNLATGANAKTDGWSGYTGALGDIKITMSTETWPTISSFPGPPHLLQSQGLRLGRLSRSAPQTPVDLCRRVHLSLQPPQYPVCRLQFTARDRRRPRAPSFTRSFGKK